MRQAVGYVRVSTAMQGKSGLGIESQRDAIARFAATEAYELIGEFVEVETGKGCDALERRPQLTAALGAGPQGEVPGHGGEARSAVPRRAFHQRPDGAQGAVHRRRAGRRLRSVHAAHLCRPRREGAGADQRAHPVGIGRQEGAGREAGQSGEPGGRWGKGCADTAPAADAFAANVLPVVRQLQAAGATTPRAIAAALNERRVRTARGGEWHDSTVRNLLQRHRAA